MVKSKVSGYRLAGPIYAYSIPKRRQHSTFNDCPSERLYHMRVSTLLTRVSAIQNRLGILWILFGLAIVACGKAPAADTAETNAAAAPESAPKKPLLLFAAAGTRGPSEILCDRFEKETGIKVERSYASSGTLARQIAEGAAPDVFISANRQWIDFLLEKQLLAADSVRMFAANALVIAAPKDAKVPPLSFTPDFDIRAAVKEKIAVGDPAYVPVGKYTDQAFEKLGWKEKLQEKLVLAKDVSAVLRYVELGECDFGVVYRSEALRSEKITVVAEIPESLHKPIRFFAADLKAQSPAGKQLSAAFVSDAGVEAFTSLGFTRLPAK